MQIYRNQPPQKFQSTPPVKAATLSTPSNARVVIISIHAAREGGDLGQRTITKACHRISIHAAREGGDVADAPPKQLKYISIHAAREGGDVSAIDVLNAVEISIHAAREGGDDWWRLRRMQCPYFNPRRP